MTDPKPASPLSWIVVAVLGLAIWQSQGSSDSQPQPGPDPAPITDRSNQAFEDYQRLWRLAQGELAKKLRSGDIKTEPQATEWFSRANNEALKTAFTPLVEAEYQRFGGEKWTAGEHAKQAQEYASGK